MPSSSTRYLFEVDVDDPYDVWSGEDFADSSPYAPRLDADLQWTAVAACLFDRIGVKDYCCKAVELAPGKVYQHCTKGCLKLVCPFFDPSTAQSGSFTRKLARPRE